MTRLARRDLQRVLEVLSAIYSSSELDAFPAHVVSALPKLISSEITTYNVVNHQKDEITWVCEPVDALAFPDSVAIFERHIGEHPLIAYYARTLSHRAVKISDFLTNGAFQRLGLYREFYRRVGIDCQVAITLPAPRPWVIGIALNRSGLDFSERDRAVLDLLGTHIAQAHANAVAFTEARRESELLKRGVETLRRGTIIVRLGVAPSMTPKARRWLAGYFGPTWRSETLPEPLRRWMRHQETATSDDVPPVREPFVVEREGRRLVVRLVSAADQSLLLLQEQRTTLSPSTLEALGLTRREAEVLAWVAEGKTNDEVGTILGARPRTVKKHLERIYQKLGVETRTAAARVALTSCLVP